MATPPPNRPLQVIFALFLAGTVATVVTAEEDQPTSPLYDMTVRSVMPLTPAEIKDLRRRVDTHDRVIATSGHPAPTLKTRSIRVSTKPGVKPRTVKLRQGFGSSLVFLDSTGQPWPIVGYMVGDGSGFTITQPQTTQRNVLNISPRSTYGVSNLSVSLQDNPVPVILLLNSKANAKVVDGVVTASVIGRGPNAATPSVGPAAIPAVSQDMIAFLDGLPPDAAKPITMKGIGGTAWRLGDRLYLRTETVIRSPAYFGVVHGANGLRVYELPLVPVLLASVQGNTVSVELKGIHHGS